MGKPNNRAPRQKIPTKDDKKKEKLKEGLKQLIDDSVEAKWHKVYEEDRLKYKDQEEEALRLALGPDYDKDD